MNERSQDLPNSYYESGTFMIFPKEYVLDYQRKDSEKAYIGFELSKMKGIDIDNEGDWQLAEAVYLYNKSQKTENFF